MREQLTFEDDADMLRLQTAWNQVLQRLSSEIPSAWFERFIKTLNPLEFSGGVAVVAAPGKFVYEWVRERYLATLQAFLSDEMGFPVIVDLRPEARERLAPNPGLVSQPTNNTAAVSLPAPARVETEPFRPNPKFTFDTYVTGQSNRLAVAGAKAVSAEPGSKYNPLFIYGQSGLGKTHLLHAIAQDIQRTQPGTQLVYVSAQKFAEEFVNALQNNRIEQFRRMQRAVGVWLLDDIQFIAGKDKTQEEIFHTFNHLYQLGKQIVVTSDRPPRDLQFMDERVRSRFEWGLVADVEMPDTETRCAIILSKARQEQIELNHAIAEYLAESVPGNIRVLEGALTKLFALGSVHQSPVDMGLAVSMVESYYRTGVMAKPDFDQIVGSVSRHFKIPTDEIKGTSRKAPIVHARHIAVYITREITGDSWKHIGTLFGDRDHTSMMHGYQKITEMMHGDKDLRATVRMLMRTLDPEGKSA